MNKENPPFLISEKTNIRDALKAMNTGGLGLVICKNEKGKITGIMTDGDFRRAILRGISLNENIANVMNRHFYHLNDGYTQEEAQKIFSTTKAMRLPVISKDGFTFIEILKKEDFPPSSKETNISSQIINIPVVIMAGGKGTRLDPFTKILPKALIPIGEKPIIEIIIDNLRVYGVKNFFISVNHKSKMIKAYFEDEKNKNYKIKYIDEDIPLGTAGALSKLKNKIKSTFLITNCDILVKTDLNTMLHQHKKSKSSLTIVASVEHYTVPYGVCKLNKDGTLKTIEEKPILDFLINAGVYLCEPDILNYVPTNTKYDMTQLISTLIKKKKTIGVYPVPRDCWIDVGQWEEYHKSLEKMKI